MSDIRSFYDTSLVGTRNDNGAIEELYGKDAFENSIIIWLTSFKGDVLRKPSRGGYLIPHLTKPMSDDRILDIKDAIQIGFVEDYEPDVILQSIEVVPDYERRKWNITIKAYAVVIKEQLTVEIGLKNLV